MRLAASLLLLISLLVTTVVAAESDAPYRVGDVLPEITLDDQHDERGGVDATTRILLFSRDMEGGKLLRAALEDTGEGFLQVRQVVYVSDISGMPKLVARLFAVPSMRRRPYPMLLDRTGEATARLPDVEEQATLLFLDDLRIERIEHVDSANGVRALLGLEPLPDDDA
jgi:hypothetical protein